MARPKRFCAAVSFFNPLLELHSWRAWGHLQREQGNMEGRQMPEKKNTHSRFDNVFFAMVVADRSYGALPGVTKSIGFLSKS